MSTEYTKIVYKWLYNAQYLILPGICIVCRKSTCQKRDICHDCASALKKINHPCLNCGLPLPSGSEQGGSCGACIVNPPSFRRLIAPFNYCPPLSGLITAFKYHSKLVNGRTLGELLCAQLCSAYQHEQIPALIIPVPLHPDRVKKRGFNQALEISRTLSTTLGLAYSRDIVSRARNTPQQTGLNARNRNQNIHSAFQLDKTFRFPPQTTIAIVDDVVTTGATVTELSKTLLKAGAREIHVWALARAVS